MNTALIQELLSIAWCQWCRISTSSCVVDLPCSAPYWQLSNLPFTENAYNLPSISPGLVHKHKPDKAGKENIVLNRNILTM